MWLICVFFYVTDITVTELPRIFLRWQLPAPQHTHTPCRICRCHRCHNFSIGMRMSRLPCPPGWRSCTSCFPHFATSSPQMSLWMPLPAQLIVEAMFLPCFCHMYWTVLEFWWLLDMMKNWWSWRIQREWSRSFELPKGNMFKTLLKTTPLVRHLWLPAADALISVASAAVHPMFGGWTQCIVHQSAHPYLSIILAHAVIHTGPYYIVLIIRVCPKLGW